jgi:hypothetical protein
MWRRRWQTQMQRGRRSQRLDRHRSPRADCATNPWPWLHPVRGRPDYLHSNLRRDVIERRLPGRQLGHVNHDQLGIRPGATRARPIGCECALVGRLVDRTPLTPHVQVFAFRAPTQYRLHSWPPWCRCPQGSRLGRYVLARESGRKVSPSRQPAIRSFSCGRVARDASRNMHRGGLIRFR